MRRHTFYSSFTLFIALFLLNCDSTTTPNSVVQNQPVIQSINVSPNNVQFSLEEDGYKDTTITLNLNASIELNGSNESPSFLVTNLSNRQVVTSGDLQSISGNDFSTSFEITTSTTQFQNYTIQVYAFDEIGNSNSAEKTVEFRGFSNSRPEIIEVNNPSEVNRPSSGELIVQFTAKATDLDGQATIDRVLVRIIDILGSEVPDSPFQMFDDGLTYNDAAASDSVYSITFPIAAIQDRSTQNFFIEYFAIDQGGIYSDTTRTTFRITNNQ